jgi:sporulation protein YabP
MSENMTKKPHMLTLDRRSLLTLAGVEDVPGFDDNTVTVRLSDATLVVKGSALHISKLSLETGDVVIDGSISSLQYLGAASKSLRSKLFK